MDNIIIASMSIAGVIFSVVGLSRAHDTERNLIGLLAIAIILFLSIAVYHIKKYFK